MKKNSLFFMILLTIILNSCSVVPLTNIDFSQFEHKNEWDRVMKDKRVDEITLVTFNNKSEKWGNDFLNYMKSGLEAKNIKTKTYLYDEKKLNSETELRNFLKENDSKFILYFTRTKKYISTRSGNADFFEIELHDSTNKAVWKAYAHIVAFDGTKQLAENLIKTMVKDGIVK